MREPLLVADSGPLIAFAKLQRLDVLRELASRLVVPPAVWREVTAERPGLADALDVTNSAWIEVVSPTGPLPDAFNRDLGPGEVEAMQLAMGLREGRLLVDEALARREALRLRLPIIGTVGLLLRAEQSGLIASAKAEATRLVGAGYFLSPALLKLAFGQNDD